MKTSDTLLLSYDMQSYLACKVNEKVLIFVDNCKGGPGLKPGIRICLEKDAYTVTNNTCLNELDTKQLKPDDALKVRKQNLQKYLDLLLHAVVDHFKTPYPLINHSKSHYSLFNHFDAPAQKAAIELTQEDYMDLLRSKAPW